ncbi:hypothetical protein E7Z59_04305 [Robertkochia marina]|uniref:Viral A-type inclusion protein n=1 Tax=Robertkochia marina TaxID=1227945 RepID=A0A4S3M446_9FLAO|nr:hypothetical protein [Robertkochia marina]THD69555.1 hypothetical protein E7Z59_04305 [Robertkochia marina]TRZ47188.1 hypothetical protein D3A96_00265 [Robertkochia marina]
MKQLLFAFACLVAITTSCKQESKKEQPNSKMAEVMAIHDEVMPKMGTIGKLVAELKPMADTSQTDSTYIKAVTDLQDAHRSMMDWMKGFGERFDSEEILKGKPLTPEKQKWLEEEEIKVKAMRDEVNQSIKNAEQLLSQ